VEVTNIVLAVVGLIAAVAVPIDHGIFGANRA
jgi:hypothetical protein